MKLVINCMECSSEIDIGDVDQHFMESFAQLAMTSTICDSCLLTRYDINMAEIEDLIEKGY